MAHDTKGSSLAHYTYIAACTASELLTLSVHQSFILEALGAFKERYYINTSGAKKRPLIV